ncbi:hypothetical protein ACFVZW_25705 [Streptomyces sp. NPDC059567]|uniref:hypothetical protein n=1 Tax=Streptomyces sp. NPDC059567 TaxID=3346867 RepID=UPI00367E7974
MTGLQGFTMGTTVRGLDPYRFPAALVDDKPADTSRARGLMGLGDCLLPPPAPPGGLSASIDPADRRRLELHAALTTAGIAPLPGDLDAIEALSALDDTKLGALLRWINAAR